MKGYGYRIYIAVIVLLWIFIVTLNAISRFSTKRITEKPTPLTEVAFAQKTVRIENVPTDTIIEVKYKVFNKGSNDLIIEDVNPDCTCTDFYVKDSIVVPSDSTIIAIYINTRNKKGFSKVNTVVTLNTSVELYKLSAILTIDD